MFKAVILTTVALLLPVMLPAASDACSTFKFQKDGALIYGHNLDQPNRNMPGMIFVNQRGVFKTGRSFTEMFFADQFHEKSDYCWISRYGSVTFAIYGRDFPDGGVNEAGIFIWEMSLVGTEYPVVPDHPRLLKMNWMQYILDSFGTLDDALSAAYDINVEGWQWHFFLGDRYGNCATVEFIDGEVVIHRGDDLPIPALFNRPYEQELEYLQLYQGFGGQYEVDHSLSRDKRVTRMARAATLLREYNATTDDPLTFSKKLLYEVGNKPYKWGVLVDMNNGQIYFNTEQYQDWKHFALTDLDFSNKGPVLTLNLDQQRGGEVIDRFHPLDDNEFRSVFKGYVDDLSDGSMAYYGISRQTLIDRFATAYREAEKPERHYFAGTWQGVSRDEDDDGNREVFSVTLAADGSKVNGEVVFREEACPIQHLRLLGNDLEFSFRDSTLVIYKSKGRFNGTSLDLHLEWINGPMGDFILQKQ